MSFLDVYGVGGINTLDDAGVPITTLPPPKGSDLRIRVLTWNMGENRRTAKQWKKELNEKELNKSWEVLLDTDSFDLLILALQEDNRGLTYGRFPDQVREKLGSGWVAKKIASSGPPDGLHKPFTVKLYVYYRPKDLPGVWFDQAAVCFKRVLVYCSKATVGIAINVPSKGQIIAMSSHFPVKTDQADMGYEKRVAAIKTSLQKVFGKLRDDKARNTVALWAGDMNFRRNTPTTPNGVKIDEQLAVAMQEGHFKVENEKGFEEHTLSFPPTCKLHACKGECLACRSESDDKRIEECFDHHREPSHCDRVLFFVDGENVTLAPKEYKSYSNSSAVMASDHNLVWADFALKW